MGYELRKYNKSGWRVVWSESKDGVRKQRYIPQRELGNLGLSLQMTREEARVQCQSLNARSKVLRQEARRNAALQRFQKEAEAAIAFLPPILCSQFEETVIQRRFDNRLVCHWRAAKRLVQAVKMEAREWGYHPEIIYRYFAERGLSPDYCGKVIRVLNLWGEFLFYKTGAPYVPLKRATGRNRERIADSYFENRKLAKESIPLTPELLLGAKSGLPEPQWNWLFISLWFGLRPQEVNQLHDSSTRFWTVEEHHGVSVLAIYQRKLVSIPRDKRWKRIPLLFPEQHGALTKIHSRLFSSPLPKTIRRHVHPEATRYAGRKGFQRLMMSLGASFVEVSAWLGHASLDRTWRSYRDKSGVVLERLKPLSATAINDKGCA